MFPCCRELMKHDALIYLTFDDLFHYPERFIFYENVACFILLPGFIIPLLSFKINVFRSMDII